ncbi:MAG: hypothetical protein AAB319_02630, partial [Pseudomonadota bacterium]
MAHLFEPLRLRGVTLPNRIAISPMCQYSATDGCANEWHFVHYGSRAVGGAGLLISEATAVLPEGRISPHDLGLWNDLQIEPVRRINAFIHAQGCISGIQLAHAGRKASTPVGWQAQRTLPADEGGWLTVGPSPLAFSDAHAIPHELDHAAIAGVVRAFAAPAGSFLRAGAGLGVDFLAPRAAGVFVLGAGAFPRLLLGLFFFAIATRTSIPETAGPSAR